jgi:hypothetical protein
MNGKILFATIGSLLCQFVINAQRSVPSAYTGSLQVSFIRTWQATAPETNSDNLMTRPLYDAKMNTVYFDGLGRPLQTVSKEGSFETVTGTKKDLVSPVEYDQFGRETFKYLPFVSSTGDGLFKTDPFQQQKTYMEAQFLSQGETWYYGQTNFEASPLDRVLKSMTAGNSWVKDGRGIENQYRINTVLDDVKKWVVNDVSGNFGNYSVVGYYPAGELYKNITIDETGNQVIEFKDKEGKTILKKVGLTATDNGSGSGYVGWLSTYYLYDDFNLLRAVIQPKAVEVLAGPGSWALTTTQLDELCFRYEYDSRGRMIMKKIPGSGALYMVYDTKDRLVLVQDANLRATDKWMITLYDALNRPVLTGILSYPGVTSLSTIQSIITTQTQTPVSPNTGLAVDLVLNNPIVDPHQAIRSITLVSDFESGTSFLAEIVNGSGGSDGETTIVEGVTVNRNPIPSGATLIALTKTFYDNYDWTDKSYTTAYNSYLDIIGINQNPENLPSEANILVTGLTTGTQVRIIEDPNNLSAGQWLTTAIFYDSKNRNIQTVSDNYKGGIDVSINRFNFSGQVLCNYLVQNAPSGIPNQIRIKTNTQYDALGRVLETWKTINDVTAEKKLLASNEYNSLGQLKKKKIASAFNSRARILNTISEDGCLE